MTVTQDVLGWAPLKMIESEQGLGRPCLLSAQVCVCVMCASLGLFKSSCECIIWSTI